VTPFGHACGRGFWITFRPGSPPDAGAFSGFAVRARATSSRLRRNPATSCTGMASSHIERLLSGLWLASPPRTSQPEPGSLPTGFITAMAPRYNTSLIPENSHVAQQVARPRVPVK
jgi:hypothetical protein